MIKYIQIVLFIALGLTNQSFANEDKCEVFGQVIESSGETISYASIAFINPTDSTVITGTATNEEGKFKLKVEQRAYILKVSFLSYNEKYLNIDLKSKSHDLGQIVLKQSTNALDELDVIAERSEMTLKLDKRVFTVGKDLANSGANASEILDNIPSVAVDVDGNVSLRGSQGVRILIDGKPSGLIGSDPANALKMFQGDMIDRVEIITNPSARYDAQGEVGIINIILKKEEREGINGVFSVSGGYPENFGASAGLNYRKSNYNFFTNYSLNYRQGPGGGFVTQTFENQDTSYYFERLREHVRGGLSHNVRLGLDYYFTAKDILTVSGLYKYSDGNNNSRLEYRDFNDNRILSKTVWRNEDESEFQENIESTINYKKTFDSDKHTLNATLKWIKSDDLETSEFVETSSVEGSQTVTQLSESTENQERYLAKVDYVKPIGEEGKFEMGAQSNMRTIENAFLVKEEGVALEGFDNIMLYTENIHAAYVMYGNKHNKLGYQFGLRSEYSDIKTELVKTKEVNPRNYLNFFPSVHLSQELVNENSLQLSYSRRLNRPGFWHLLPFFNFSDPRSIFSGNPDLDPEYTNSFEFGHLKYWEKGSLMSSVYYRHRTGVTERITVVDDEGFTRMFPINLSTQDAFGLEFNASKDIQDWWKLNASFNFYRAITNGEYEGEKLYSDNYSWTSRLSSKITLFKKVDFQLTGNYRAPQVTTQGSRKAMYFVNTGLSMDVLKKNGTISFSGRDIFNSRKRIYTTETNGLFTDGYFQWRSRQFLVTFSYRLNQKKQRGGGENFGGGEGGEF